MKRASISHTKQHGQYANCDAAWIYYQLCWLLIPVVFVSLYYSKPSVNTEYKLHHAHNRSRVALPSPHDGIKITHFKWIGDGSFCRTIPFGIGHRWRKQTLCVVTLSTSTYSSSSHPHKLVSCCSVIRKYDNSGVSRQVAFPLLDGNLNLVGKRDKEKV